METLNLEKKSLDEILVDPKFKEKQIVIIGEFLNRASYDRYLYLVKRKDFLVIRSENLIQKDQEEFELILEELDIIPFERT